MHLPKFEYVRPESLAHCLMLMGELKGRVAVMAGGTDLLASMGQRLVVPQFVIGLRWLEELRGVAFGDDGALPIGAGPTLSTLVDGPGRADRVPRLHEAHRAVRT
jgi:carbon-monoxide dehydrogenase medium subunit